MVARLAQWNTTNWLEMGQFGFRLRDGCSGHRDAGGQRNASGGGARAQSRALNEEEQNMKKGTLSVGVIIPITLIGLTLIALILMNQAHASGGF